MADAHGVRRRYQLGCRCPVCSAANTAYMTTYRAAKRAQRPVLGARVDGREATRILATLLAEGYLKREIAIWLGHQHPVLHWRAGARVTVRSTLRLRMIQRRQCQ